MTDTPEIAILTTGGTIDKIYFDALSEFTVGETALRDIIREANVAIDCSVTSLMHKDSLELTDDDRKTIYGAVEASSAKRVVITHGTDTMADTARTLMPLGKERTIVLTGAMLPASQRQSDALFNVGFAIASAQLAGPGVYIAMNARLFDADHVRKDRKAKLFVETDGD